MDPPQNIMFVYLDHAHFSALDQLLRRDPPAFAGFLAFWLEHECQLLVSRAHLHEIGQCDHEDDVQKRLDVLRYFPLWATDERENVDWVIIREMLEQTLNRLHADSEAGSAGYGWVGDPLYRPASIADVELFVRRARPGLLDEMQTRRTYAARENLSLALRKAYTKTTRKKASAWDPEGWRLLRLVQSTVPYAGGDRVADRWTAEVDARMEECWKNAKKERHFLICAYDLQGMACLDRARKEELYRIGFYRALGKEWVFPFCRAAGHDDEAVWAALNQFDPYDAPGISASLAVERGRKAHEKAREASDYMDVDHVLWAASADLAFIDRRTHGFLLQARKNAVTAKLLSPHLRARFERAADLDDVKRHIKKVRDNQRQQ
jgi:hypothetical protein